MTKSRSLVVYYSRSGTTRKVAQELARLLVADLEEIVEPKGRTGFLGYWRSVREARQKTPATIVPARLKPSAYGLVIVCTPVWAWSVSSPVRAYLMSNRSKLRNIAFVCTMGGSGDRSAFAQMQQIVGKTPRAVLAVSAQQASRGSYGARLSAFARALQSPASASDLEMAA